jgi:hypothetical protein
MGRAQFAILYVFMIASASVLLLTLIVDYPHQ